MHENFMMERIFPWLVVSLSWPAQNIRRCRCHHDHNQGILPRSPFKDVILHLKIQTIILILKKINKFLQHLRACFLIDVKIISGF